MSEKQLTFRRATLQDSELLFGWRNSASVYKFFRNPTPVEWDAHLNWLTNVVNSTQSVILIAEDLGLPIGMARFDIRSDGSAEVSIHLDPIFIGKGFGTKLLSGAEKKILFLNHAIRLFCAEIHVDNLGSKKLFERLGYKKSRETKGFFEFYQKAAL